MKFDRRLLLNFDWILLLLSIGISIIGILNIYSAGLTDPGMKLMYVRQLQWLFVGCIAMILAFSIDYRAFLRHAYTMYTLVCLCLLLVLVLGDATRGSQRWLALGGISFQPSEFMKIALILVLAKYFENHKSEGGYFIRDLIMPLLIALLPFILVLKQPDLGTGIILLMLLLAIVFIAGIKWKSIAIAAGCGLLLIPISWHFLHDYQKERVMTFLHPEKDPLGTGYHIIQSMIAVGSGEFWGKGFLEGTQTQLKFLPEQHTDFVFSVFAEEWGLFGSSVLMMLFFSITIWGIKIAADAKDLGGKLISTGVSILILGQVFINIGMVTGILPVVGIPLPFMSYGGSSLMVFMFAIGLLLNVRMRRFVFYS